MWLEPEAMTGGATEYRSQMAQEPESFIGRSYELEPEAMTGVVGGASVYGGCRSQCLWYP